MKLCPLNSKLYECKIKRKSEKGRSSVVTENLILPKGPKPGKYLQLLARPYIKELDTKSLNSNGTL